MRRPVIKLAVAHKIFLFIAGIILLFVVFYFYLLRPQLQQLSAYTAQYWQGYQRVRVIQGFARAHPDISSYESEIDTSYKQVNKILPDDTEIGEFIAEIGDVAAKSGIRLARVVPGAYSNRNAFYEIPIEVAAQGSYFQLLDFLKRMEQIPRFNSINNVTVQSKNGKLESKLTVVIYCYGSIQPGPGDTYALPAVSTQQGR